MVSSLIKEFGTKSQSISENRFRVDYIGISSFEEAKDLFGNIDLEERNWRGEKYFNAILTSPRSRLGLGEHDRAEAYIFGNGSFPEGDKKSHERHFPIPVKVMKIDELFLAPYEIVDLSAYTEEFPWNVGYSEIYLYLIVNKLILSPQSKLLVQGNVFVLECKEVVGNNLEDNQAIIELRGSNAIQHSVLSVKPQHKITETHGRNGKDGELLKYETTPLGLRLNQGTEVNKGEKGTDGTKGIDGKPGPNGAMLFLSDLRFGQLNGLSKKSIKIIAGAAPGFSGTNGGHAGNGGNGGNGANGAVTPFGIVKGCEGGAGGNGGNGGNGGKGGSGGLACDVFVSAPYQKSYVFDVETFESQGGVGGKGGNEGKGGKAGKNGEHCEVKNSKSLPLDGKDGAKGINGSIGKTRAAPKVNFYERNKLNNF